MPQLFLVMIRTITAADTYPLRHQVLWPEQPLDFVKVPEDEAGYHYGYFVKNELVSVISLFIDTKHHARFRKFATHPNYQKKGIGTALLQAVFEEAVLQKATQIWCDARLEAAPFYQRFGMYQEGVIFYKGPIPYVKMLKML